MSYVGAILYSRPPDGGIYTARKVIILLGGWEGKSLNLLQAQKWLDAVLNICKTEKIKWLDGLITV
jgi:hypothetical protein